VLRKATIGLSNSRSHPIQVACLLNPFVVDFVPLTATAVNSHPRHNVILSNTGSHWQLDGFPSPQRLERHPRRRNGLGKPLQTISFLSYLRHYRDIPGPHLIVVPKSTLQNWAREFERWMPDVKCVVVTGSKEERAETIQSRLITNDFDVCVTSYEICLIEKSAMKKFSFQYIVINEAHRIKNVDSMLAQIVRAFTSRGRLLITGTPLQNNLKEVFALVCPESFSEFSDLDSFLRKDDSSSGAYEKADEKAVEAL